MNKSNYNKTFVYVFTIVIFLTIAFFYPQKITADESAYISIGNTGDYSNLNLFNYKTISENGDYVVFSSKNNETEDFGIYLYEKEENTFQRITEIPDGGVGQEILATISDNGQYVAIISSVLFGEEISFLLFDKLSGQTEIIATEAEIPLSLGNMMGTTMSISNDGDIVFSTDFYTSMMGLVLLSRGIELPPEFTIPSIYLFNNNNNEISLIAEINENDLSSPYRAYISANGEEIIYNNIKLILNPDPELDPQMVGEYLSYNVSTHDFEEINIISDIDFPVFLSSSISSNGRFLSFLTVDTFLTGGLSEESSLLVIYDRQLNQVETISVYDYLIDSLFLESEVRLVFNSTDISDNGRYVLLSFSSLIKYSGGEGETETVYPLFIYDSIKNESLVLDNGNSYMSASISSDGKYITFSSPNSITDDDNDNHFDVFIMANPLYEEEGEETQPGSSNNRRTGSSRVLLARFQQQQIERAIAAGIENYVSDYCTNVPALQSEVPEGWVVTSNYECFFDEVPLESIPAEIPEPTSPNPPTNLPPKEIVPVPAVEENPILTINDEPQVVADPELTPPSIPPTEKDNIFERFINFLQSLTGKIIINAIAGIGIISGLSIGIFNSLFINSISLSEIPLIPLRFWNFIMLFFGFKKKTRPWGTVYDSVTKQPLDPVYVSIMDLNGNEIASSITDLDGRYGFLIPPGRYRISAGKANYEFPSKKLLGQSSDVIYQDLYFNEIIEVKEGEVVTKNIPMDPLKFDWNEFTKKDKNLMKFFSRRDLWITRISNWLFTIGLIFSLTMLFTSPSVFNTIVFAIYIIILIVKKLILKPKIFGQITNTEGFPLSYAIIRIFRKENSSEIIHKVANELGKYYCLVPNGNYYAKIEKKNFDESYSTVYTSESIEVTKGYIHNKFKI